MLFSQSNNASINGEVTDPNGAVVTGAKVLLTSKDTKESSSFTSDADGLYSFRNVVPGTYQLQVSAAGFGEYVQDGILVRVGYPIRQNVQLRLETTTQQVEVTANASALNFENAELRGSIDPQVIQEVPLLVSGSIRSAANFASLLPGVVRGSGDVTGAHVNGGQSQTGIVVLDGIALFNSSGTQGLTGAVLDFPQSPDLISEFQVLTSNYDAQYGSAGGVTIENVRSGTSSFSRHRLRIQSKFLLQRHPVGYCRQGTGRRKRFWRQFRWSSETAFLEKQKSPHLLLYQL